MNQEVPDSDLSVLYFYLNKSPYLGLSIKKKANGDSGIAVGVQGAEGEGAALLNLKVPGFLNPPNICSLGARSARQTLFGCLLGE